MQQRFVQAMDAARRGLATAAEAVLVGLPATIAVAIAIALVPTGVGLLLWPPAAHGLHVFVSRQLRRVGENPVELPATSRRRSARTAREAGWSAVNVPVGLVLGLLPAALLGNAALGLVAAPVVLLAGGRSPFWWIAMPIGVVTLTAFLLLADPVMRGYRAFAGHVARPGRAELDRRVGELSTSRADALDASAAEIRRIERDLHDGPQARLAALGLAVGLAEQLVRDDPDQALELLAEAREASGQALAELRHLVRGIHPPVLAERGLDHAVRALAVQLPLPVTVRSDDGPRLPASVEAAAYFTVAELLANVVKHADAQHVQVALRRDGGVLRLTVADDGRGGAAASGSGGLAGLRRRLAPFDGRLDLSSPVGGPTLVTVELLCAS